MDCEIGPEDSYEARARRLRWLYRRVKGAEHWREIRAEYERLFPDAEVGLDQILVNVWREARELAGWSYDTGAQCWRRQDGSVVVEDDGSEWAHL